MALQKITLEAAAKAFRVHPRTIVRALSGEHNTYWYEDINHDLYTITELAAAFDMEPKELRRVIEKREVLLKPQEAAKLLGIQPRTFRDRVHAGRYRKVANYSGRVVRYFRSKIPSLILRSIDMTAICWLGLASAKAFARPSPIR